MPGSLMIILLQICPESMYAFWKLVINWWSYDIKIVWCTFLIHDAYKVASLVDLWV